jgi:predicted amidohydrolase YtcJ
LYKLIKNKGDKMRTRDGAKYLLRKISPLKTAIICLFGMGVLILFSSGCQSTRNSQTADMILTNGKIATIDDSDDFAQAIAIKDGKILATGDAKKIAEFKDSNTQEINLNGRTVIPGLNDSHTHLIRGGLNYNMELRWDGVPSLKQALQMLKEQAVRTPKGQWVRVVGGWSEFQFEEQRLPTLDEINEAAPNTPVFVMYLYSLGFMNKAAIDALGYDSNTHYPGGVIELNNAGNPTGLLIAKPSALLLYSTLVKAPKLSTEDQINSTLHYYRELNRLGLTSSIDAGGGGQFYPENYEVAKKLAQEGKLTIRIAYYLFAQEKGKELQSYQKWTNMVKPFHNDDMLHVNGYMMHGGGENLTWSAADFRIWNRI